MGKVSTAWAIGALCFLAAASASAQVVRDGAGDDVTAPPIVSSDIGKPVPSDGVIVFNIFATIDQVPGGTYYVALRAVGPGGSSIAVPSELFTK